MPSLTLLRIRITPRDVGLLVSGTLATISASNCIRKIVIFSAFPRNEWTHDWQQLDRLLSTLSTRDVPVVEFEMQREEYERLMPFLPRMKAKNMVDPFFVSVFH